MPKYVGQMMKNLIKIVLEGGKHSDKFVWKFEKIKRPTNIGGPPYKPT